MRRLLSLLCLCCLPLAAYAGDPPVAPPSANEDGALSWDDAAPALVCEDPQRFWPGSCRGTFALTVQATRAMRPLRAVLTERVDKKGARILYDYEPVTLVAGQRWQVPRAPTVQRAGRWLFVLTYADAAGVERQLAAEITVSNPALEAAVQACGACDGQFKRWGLMGREWCNCRPADAGKPCQDGRDCEGTCLAKKPKTPNDAPGQCSSLKALFGCHTRIEHDPTHPAGRRTTTICAD